MDPPFWQQITLKLLDWPMLLFVAIAIVVTIFHNQIASALGGDIRISWGTGRIRIKQLSKNLDKELDPIRDEIDRIKEAVTVLESASARTAGAPPMQPTETKPLMAEDQQKAFDRMLDALRDGRYVWRSIERLAIIGRVSEAQAHEMLLGSAKVVVGTSKAQRPLARLKTRAP